MSSKSLKRRYGRAAILAFVLVSWLCGSCAAPGHQACEPWDQPALRATLLARIRQRNPEAVRLTQRILLEVRGREYDMAGYLYRRADGSRFALALGEMGVEVFRFRFDPPHGEVIVSPPSIPTRPLLDGVVADLQHLFGTVKPDSAYLVRCRDAGIGLVLKSPGQLDEYRFDGAEHCLVSSSSVRQGRVIREARYDRFAEFPAVERALPCRIILRNHRWHYSMEIRLLDVALLTEP